MKNVCVFCGSHIGRGDRYRVAAEAFGGEPRRGLGLVYGGGHVGLMGVVADAVLAAGGRVVGVIPRFLMEREVGHSGLTELHVVESMHERKATMAALADAFVALPGASGPSRSCSRPGPDPVRSAHPPVGLLAVGEFFDPLLAYLDRTVEEGFVALAQRRVCSRFRRSCRPTRASASAGSRRRPPSGRTPTRRCSRSQPFVFQPLAASSARRRSR
ncbi:MAG: TIGR00730 family Rossman fold protein [Thermoanaerobaculia bacterium]